MLKHEHSKDKAKEHRVTTQPHFPHTLRNRAWGGAEELLRIVLSAFECMGLLPQRSEHAQ